MMGRLVHTGLGSSSLAAHVLLYPLPPTRTGTAVIRTLVCLNTQVYTRGWTCLEAEGIPSHTRDTQGKSRDHRNPNRRATRYLGEIWSTYTYAPSQAGPGSSQPNRRATQPARNAPRSGDLIIFCGVEVTELSTNKQHSLCSDCGLAAAGAPGPPHAYSLSTHRFPDERTPVEDTPLSATSAELVSGLGLGLGFGAHFSAHAPSRDPHLPATLLSHNIPFPRVHKPRLVESYSTCPPLSPFPPARTAL